MQRPEPASSSVLLFPFETIVSDRPRAQTPKPSEPHRSLRISALELEMIEHRKINDRLASAAKRREEERQATAIAAALANGKSMGHSAGYEAGFKASALWHGMVGAFYGMVGGSVLVVGFIMLGLRVRHLW